MRKVNKTPVAIINKALVIPNQLVMNNYLTTDMKILILKKSRMNLIMKLKNQLHIPHLNYSQARNRKTHSISNKVSLIKNQKVKM